MGRDKRRTANRRRRRRQPRVGPIVWARRLVLSLLVTVVGLIVVLPVALTLFYRVVPPPVTPLMVIRLFEGEGLERHWTPLTAMSPPAVRAVLASEDSRFCQHGGVDWHEMREAIADWQDDGQLRGASTISMQTAKNVFLWPGRSYTRKLLEAYMTVLIEALWPKQRILEVYLNIAEWGPGIYGIDAAARHYFGKPAGALTAREGALLAVVLPNPRRWSPARPTAYISSRAWTIGTRARQIEPFLDCI